MKSLMSIHSCDKECPQGSSLCIHMNNYPVTMLKNTVFCVRYLTSDDGGLHQDSTATRHTFAGVPLWLYGPTHPGQVALGQLTTAPSVSSLARHRTCASRYCGHPPDQREACSHIARSGSCR